MSDIIYFDYNATNPMKPEVKQAISEALDIRGNASSVHACGRTARKHIEAARQNVATLAGVTPDEVVFTCSATESNNTILKGLDVDRILISSIEHPSVMKSAPDAEHIPVGEDGVVDLNALEDALKQGGKTLVSIMWVNNETGVIQPMAKISKLCKDHGALLHSDAVQAAGRFPVNVKDVGIDYLSLSAHKMAGPQGVGATIITRDDVPLVPLLTGGRHEKGRRAGTENFLGIVGFGKAAELAVRDMEHYETLAGWRDRIEDRILELAPEAHIFGKTAPRIGNTSAIGLCGVGSDTQMMNLDLAGVCVSGGSACSSGTITPSHVALAMGADKDLATCAIRISMGWQTTEDEVQTFLTAWEEMYTRVKDKIANA